MMILTADKLVKVNQEETTLNGLVFVERKHTAFALHKYIEELCIWDCDMYFIRSSFMIGTSRVLNHNIMQTSGDNW